MEQPTQGEKIGKALWAAVALNSLLIGSFFIWGALVRNVDGDEGLYLEAARLAGSGKKLYLEFFFQQMPWVPYFLAGIGKAFGYSLFPSRIFCAILSSFGASFVLYYSAKISRSFFVVAVCSVMLFSSGIFFAWAPVIKTHPFSIFFLTASVVLVLLWNRQGGKVTWYLLFAGLLLGMGVNSRLTLAPFPLLFLGYVLSRGTPGTMKNLGLFFLGLLLSGIPTFYYLALDSGLFVKYNLLFHTKIFPGISSREFRLSIAKQVLLQPQIFFLLVLGYAGLLIRGRDGWSRFLASDQFFIGLLVLAYFSIHLSAAMPFTQYFSAIVPLLVMATLPVWEWTLRITSSLRCLVVAPILVAYSAFAPKVFHHELYSVGSLEPQWKIQNINAAVNALRDFAKPGEVCLTWWPGYAAMAGCQSFPGMENHMREHAILRGISARKLKEYKLLPAEELVAALEDKKVNIVVDGAYRLTTPYDEYAEYLLHENYRLRFTRGGVRFYSLATPGELEVQERTRDVESKLHDLETGLVKKQVASP
ncbi:MAG: hypothetical protein U1F66_05235 [bacterium]